MLDFGRHDVQDTQPIRRIIHVDMDAFYASIEERDNPSLKNFPLAVGSRGGVVLTANYLARPFKVHSGLPGFMAVERCPQLVFAKPRFDVYKAVSRQVHEIFRRYTSIVAPRSLDEAYLDVTNNDDFDYAVDIANQIRNDIRAETGLTCSAGVAANMMLAKIASDFRKPDGVTVVAPPKVRDFLRDLPLRKIPGIGPATEKHLLKLDLTTCADIWALDDLQLGGLFNERMATWLRRKTEGIDHRDVAERHERKSYGAQNSIGAARRSLESLESEFARIAATLQRRLETGGFAGRTISIKVRYGDLSNCTRAMSLDKPTNAAEEIVRVAGELLRRTEANERRVGLVGLTVSNLTAVSDLDAT